MGLLGGLAKAGIAKKVFNEARKPRNQAKLKRMISKLTGKGSGATSASRSRGRR